MTRGEAVLHLLHYLVGGHHGGLGVGPAPEFDHGGTEVAGADYQTYWQAQEVGVVELDACRLLDTVVEKGVNALVP